MPHTSAASPRPGSAHPLRPIMITLGLVSLLLLTWAAV